MEMRISDKYFNQLNPSYQKVIKELEQKLNEYEDDEAKSLEAMLEFASMYLMPVKYWSDVALYSSNIDEMLYMNSKKLYENAKRAYYHFYYDVQRNDLANPEEDTYTMHKTLNFTFSWEMDDDQDEYKPDESDFCFPHSHLNKVFYKIESESNRPLSKELFAVYEMNKRYYEKIRAAKNDVDHWFKLLCKAADANNDEDFIRHNVEYRLGSNLLDTKLWKLYIEYLRERDPAEMLQVYSKYCRFFLDDSEMKERYKQEVEKYGPVYVPWKNLFDFELHIVEEDNSEKESNDDKLADEEEKESQQLKENESNNCESKASNVEGPSAPKRFKPSQAGNEDQSNDKSDKPTDTVSSTSGSIDISLLCTNFYDNFQPQSFSFKKPFISYILENSNPTVLRKLHQSCKYFFDRRQTPICHRIRCTNWRSDRTYFREESLELAYIKDYDLRQILKNTHITTMFDIRHVTPSLTSQIILRLSRCDAKYIYINCNLTDEEMKFLFQSGNTVILHWRNWAANVQPRKLEEITQYLPKIEELQLAPVAVTSQTFATLFNQEYLSTIYSLGLLEIEGNAFNVDEFLEYCKQNRAEYFKLKMRFCHTFPDRDVFVKNLQKRMLLEHHIHHRHTDVSFS